MPWWFGYRVVPDGRVCISKPYEDPDLAKMERDKLRAPDLKVTSRINAENEHEALRQAKKHFTVT
ncbi:hypothetical protein [Alteromonas gracilis]|uniref:hypothetical protein n=1 Tax=Alteromonas gracilis TaxID=1479524 RepID=UPI003736A994